MTQIAKDVCLGFFATQVGCGNSCVCERATQELERELPDIVRDIEDVLLSRDIVDYTSKQAAIYAALLVVERMKEKQKAASDIYFDETRRKNRFSLIPDSNGEYDIWADIPQVLVHGPEGYEEKNLAVLEQPTSTMPEGD
ncbi:MAG: hypothetical protein RIQ54_553 [Candidatus Parcubacteria bacterium]|jgi:hypothetical protein